MLPSAWSLMLPLTTIKSIRVISRDGKSEDDLQHIDIMLVKLQLHMPIIDSYWYS